MNLQSAVILEKKRKQLRQLKLKISDIGPHLSDIEAEKNYKGAFGTDCRVFRETGVKKLDNELDTLNFPIPDTFVKHNGPAEETRHADKYECDEEDQIWLEVENKKRGLNGKRHISQEVFNVTIYLVEKETCYQQPPASPSDACNTCQKGQEQDLNLLIYCERCSIGVHQECYGVTYVPDGQWLCRKCQLCPGEKVRCELCPNRQGAFKPTVEGKWAHVYCAIWISETEFVNTTTLEPIKGVEEALKKRELLKCLYCKLNTGACVQCAEKDCLNSFHVFCGMLADVEMKTIPVLDDQGEFLFVERSVRCHLHSKDAIGGGTLDEMRDITKCVLAASRQGLFSTTNAFSFFQHVPSFYADAVEGIVERIGDESMVESIIEFWHYKRMKRFGAPIIPNLKWVPMNLRPVQPVQPPMVQPMEREEEGEETMERMVAIGKEEGDGEKTTAKEDGVIDERKKKEEANEEREKKMDNPAQSRKKEEKRNDETREERDEWMDEVGREEEEKEDAIEGVDYADTMESMNGGGEGPVQQPQMKLDVRPAIDHQRKEGEEKGKKSRKPPSETIPVRHEKETEVEIIDLTGDDNEPENEGEGMKISKDEEGKKMRVEKKDVKRVEGKEKRDNNPSSSRKQKIYEDYVLVKRARKKQREVAEIVRTLVGMVEKKEMQYLKNITRQKDAFTSLYTPIEAVFDEFIDSLMAIDNEEQFKKLPDQLYEFHHFIDHPMTFEIMKENVKKGKYEREEELKDDLDLIFRNNKNFYRRTEIKDKDLCRTMLDYGHKKREEMNSAYEDLVKHLKFMKKWRNEWEEEKRKEKAKGKRKATDLSVRSEKIMRMEKNETEDAEPDGRDVV